MFSQQLYNNNNKINQVDELFNQLSKVAITINDLNDEMFDLFHTLFNYQLETINLNFIVMDYKNNDFSEIILSLCYKNLISLISAVELIKKGFIGSPKIIFRNVYESLLIGKLIGVTEDKNYYDNWYNGKQFSMRKDIFQKLENKISEESIEFWDILNKYTHSTIYSQRFMLDIDNSELENCNAILTALLAMNYHLLNNFVSRYYDYYLNYYGGHYYKELKNSVKKSISYAIKMIDPRCKKVIKDYNAKWRLK